MVRNYKKKKADNVWVDSQLKLAIDDVKKGSTIKSSANKYNIPRSTLQRRLKHNSMCSRNSGFKRTFSDEEEFALTELIIDMERRLTGFSTKELRKFAYDFATKLNISNKFDKKSGLAGKDWLRNFLQRHNLSNRKAEATSTFNKQEVDKFFNLLRDLREQYNFSPDNIWNVDEIQISIVPNSGSRIIDRKERKQGGGNTFANEGETVTAEICMSATGLFMPPMLIFPGINVNEEYLIGSPEGSWAVWNNSEWIETNMFIEWFKKFIEISKASVDNPVLLLLNDHYKNIKTLKVAELEKENGVTILCFPQQCTHRMQPLDVSFMKLFKTYYTEEINLFQCRGVPVEMKDIFLIIGKVWKKAAKMDTAINSFKITGIEPLNIYIFDAEFISIEQNVQPETECFDTIEVNKKILCDIMLNNNEDTSTAGYPNLNSNTEVPLAANSNCIIHSTDTSEPTVQIPLSYILNAKPLILLLNSIIAEQEKAKNVTQNTESKKRGTTTHVTSEEHIEELYIQKLKKLKKELDVGGTKNVPKIKSEVRIKNIIPNQTATTSCGELNRINYELKQTCSQSVFINTEVPPTDVCTSYPNGTYLLQTDNGQYEPYILETIPI